MERRTLGLFSYYKGHLAEWYVSWYLRILGYHILFQSYKGSCFELDLIAKKGKVLYFFEVKNLKYFYLAPQQMRAIKIGIQSFLQRYPEFLDYDLQVRVLYVRGLKICDWDLSEFFSFS